MSTDPAPGRPMRILNSAISTVAVRGLGGLAAIVFAALLVRSHGAQSGAIAAFFTGTAAYRLAAALASGGSENAVISAAASAQGPDASRGERAGIAVAAIRASSRWSLRWSATVAVIGAAATAISLNLTGADSTVTAAVVGVALAPTLSYLRIVSRATVATLSPPLGASAESLLPQLLLLATLLVPLPSQRFALWLLVLQALFALGVALAVHLAMMLSAARFGGGATGGADLSGIIRENAGDMLVINLLAATIEQFDVLVLGFLTPPAQVNTYALAKRLVGPLVLVAGGIATHYVPSLSRAYRHDGAAVAARRLRALRPRLLLLAAAGSLAVLVAGVVAAPASAGATFYAVLVTLTVGQAANLLAGPVGLFLQTTGDAGAVRRISVRLGIAYVAATLVVVPLAGAIGAAMVQSGSTIVRNAWSLYRVKAREG